MKKEELRMLIYIEALQKRRMRIEQKSGSRMVD